MEKVWLKSYQEGVPHEINPLAYTSLVDMFEQSCVKYAQKPAYTNFSHSITFDTLNKKSRDFAAFLQNDLNLKKGDRIALMMPNILQYPIALFGALRAGLIVVNVNPLYTADELIHQINDAKATTVIVLENFAHTVAKSLDKTNLKNIIITKMGDELPAVKSVLINFVMKYVKKMVPKWRISNTISYKETHSKGAKSTLRPINLDIDDIAFLQYTGGTTGVSKGALLSHGNLIANVEQAYAWITPAVNTPHDIIVTALPLYHIFSLTANCLTFIKIGAENVLITNPRDMDRFVKTIKHLKFSVITGVNTLFNALLHHKDIAEVDFSHLTLTLGGGMAVQKAVATKWEELTKAPLLEAYGLTETSPAVTINPMNLASYNGSIGLPLPSTDIKITDDEGIELPIGEAGELQVKGPQVMRGYYENEDETKKVLSEDGWLKTGDVATIDEDGFVRIVDRKKDMILISGFNVYPNEIEDVIASHHGVLEVCVVGRIKQNGNEMVKAFIVKRDPELTYEQVESHCREHLTAYKIPKEIEFLKELPKSNVGKVIRRLLRDTKGTQEQNQA